MNKQRIAIVGAGISGLSAAYYLKQKGYNNVVVFEAQDDVGGKIKTVERNGKHYEMGGVFVQESFATIKELLAAHDESLSAKHGMQTVVWKDQAIASNMTLNRGIYGLFKIAKDFFKLWRMMQNSDKLDTAAMVDSEAVFFANFNELSQQAGIESIPAMVAPFITGMGYGFTDKTPSLYQLKLMKRAFGFALALEINNQFGTSIPGTYFVKNGYQNFLEKMAAAHELHLNSPVETIVRGAENAAPVQLTVNGEQHDFDRVILATPPSNMQKYLDMKELEAFLFEKSKHYYFRATLFLGKNLPRDKMVFFPESTQSDKLGCVNSLINWHPEQDYFSAYQLFDEHTSVEKLDAELVKTIADMGGEIEAIDVQEVFNYFPHYLAQDLAEHAPYERLEALQGENNTFYLGAAVCAESAGDVATYAKALVARFF